MDKEKNTIHLSEEQSGDKQEEEIREDGATRTSPAPAIQSKPSLAVPISIIVAGILIAGAILANGIAGNRSAAPTGGSPAVKLKKSTIAEEVGLNKKAFTECLASGRHAADVETGYQSGIKAGVQGTPFSVILAKSGEMFPISGAQPYDTVKQMIEAALSGGKGGAKIALDPVTEKDHISGNPGAELLIIEYSDPECPFCKKFHETMTQAMNEYGKSGKVAWVYRHFPLDSIHSRARREAEAIECAGELGGNDKFWAYLNKLMEITPSNNQLDPKLL